MAHKLPFNWIQIKLLLSKLLRWGQEFYWQQIPLLTIGEPPLASIGITIEFGNAVRHQFAQSGHTWAAKEGAVEPDGTAKAAAQQAKAIASMGA